MNHVSLIFLYIFSCSTVLIYGIGLEKAYQDSRSPRLLLSRIPPLTVELLIAVPIARGLTVLLLVPNGLGSITPMAVFFVCSLTLLVLSTIAPAPRNLETGERIFFFGTVYLSISEGITFLGSVSIALASLGAFLAVSILLIAIRARFASSRISEDWKGIPIILVSLGLLFIILNAADALWWLQGGIRQ